MTKEKALPKKKRKIKVVYHKIDERGIVGLTKDIMEGKK